MTLCYIRPNCNIFTVQKSHLPWGHEMTLTSHPREVTLRVSVELSPPLPKVTSHGHEVTFGPLCRVAPSTIQSHLEHIFSPCVHILTSCAPSTIQSHLTYTFSPHIHILTSRTYSHLACPLHHSKSPHAHLAHPHEVTFTSKWSHAPTRGDFALYKAKL